LRKGLDVFAASRSADGPGRFTELDCGRKANLMEHANLVRLAKATVARLMIAKLDRRFCNATFPHASQDGGGQFVAAGKPEPNDHIKGMVAPVTKAAYDAISRRIKEAFAAKTANA
jgi:hypothetical protein